jgi:hypothetical protein
VPQGAVAGANHFSGCITSTKLRQAKNFLIFTEKEAQTD